jgi:tetratricopeptide (TPR) repeat protein
MMKLHAFVAMPFGLKQDNQGNEIDFNRVYAELIKPALEELSLDVFRADEEERAGDIRTDMFQELLIADLVVVDLTLENPNVWYELGVRHALRARGVILICGGRVTTAFDLYTDRKLRYGLKDYGPDPATLEKDKLNLIEMVKVTMESWHERKTSPVYHLLPNLQEPDWKSLRIGDVCEFWDQHEAWERRIALARISGFIGDILVLADEAPIAAFRAEAWIKAGKALRQAQHFNFAFEQLERGLAVVPTNLRGLRELGICLQRLALAGKPGHSLDRARAHYRYVLEIKNYERDAETWALLGRIDKDAWIAAWYQPGKSTSQWRNEAAYEDALLRSAIESYAKGYRYNLGHYYSGINALTLMHLYRDLTGDTRYDKEMAVMAGAVRYAAETVIDESELFWSKVTLGDLEVLVGTPQTVKVAYREAIARNDKDWFALNSSLAQLNLMQDLGFHVENVEAGIVVFERALHRLTEPKDRWQPRQVFLFSGHLIDAPGRPITRFPAKKEFAASQRIAEILNQLGAGPEDLMLTQGACGGDLLFTEACQQRSVKGQWLQPFNEPEFIQKSVICSGEAWRERYMIAKTNLTFEIRSAPDQLGTPPRRVNPYERCNLWLLYTALSYGIDKVHFICLWDGGGSDGPGGTAHMYEEVNRRTGKVTWIDSRDL